ncbi:MAG: hypothetical protein MJ177_00150 [Clostridia bacterium]|nr:hypothetical protein [Clostridia bacterium]
MKNSLLAAFGLFLFAFGVYLTIQADIGVAPWDAFNLGLSSTFGIKYGTASIIVSFVIVVIDVLLKEQIGIGMFLDAVLVGKSVDFFSWTGLVSKQEKLVFSLPVMAAGIIIMGFSQFLYMKASLGCGPRDTLLVGLKRRAKKIPIGLISVCILAIVTLAGYLLGGSIGIGTVICALLTGPVMQLDFKIVKFDPTVLKHQNIIESFKVFVHRTQ